MAIPYFSQFETPDIINAVMREGVEPALRSDPLWAASGALDIDDYARWAAHVCGMACLKMILAARSGTEHQTLDLARRCTAHGGYVEDARTGAIKGLIYAPFVAWIASDFGLSARIVTDRAATDLPEVMAGNALFIASVHPFIRTGNAPPRTGGHLVLVTAATSKAITFHNPSGHTPKTRETVTLGPEAFSRYFAGRGIVVLP